MSANSPEEVPDTSIDTGDFGRNLWVVEEMYRKFQDAPESVSNAWKEFFADYRPALETRPVVQEETVTPLPTQVPGDGEITVDDAELSELRGGSATIARRMEQSRALPTATSVRTLPAKLLEVNRTILNNQLDRFGDGGKVSFTHIIGWAVARALGEMPAMNAAYREVEGKPHRVLYRHIHLGLAMDIERKDGSRTLLVPSIKGVDEMDFRRYWLGYEDIVRRVRSGEITPDDFAGTTATLTNPGTVGTVQSVPRLMPDQGVIVGVGAIKYPPEYEGADPSIIADAGVGRVLTVTSTYDHRIIQGAESGLFLQRIHQLLLGEDGFYDHIFDSMNVPYVPARWAVDSNPPPGGRLWAEKQARIFQLINMYRVRGHLIADLDPLRQRPPLVHPELDIATYGLTIWDLDRKFATGGLADRLQMSLVGILGVLRDAYGRTSGLEYMHIQEPDQKLWIQEHVEGSQDDLSIAEKRRILLKLTEAEAFERFLHTKFLGAKRFSLEGSESLIPLLDTVLNRAADAGMEQAVVGMAHRGRLNVLANLVGKSKVKILREFEGSEPDPVDPHFSGDVKYHLGAEGTHQSPSGNSIAVEVAANPSHLEAIDPVLQGIARAKQDERGEGADDILLPVLIHGDAAFAGQGVVAETFNISQLPGYYTGGTVHIVVNNQVGFTTSVHEARSSTYATDVAKGVQAPIFHVNGDDPEAVVRVASLAFHFRQAFNKDVVIDLITYRRLGHNEGDEPRFTQPNMYRLIDEQRSVRKLYLERLLKSGEVGLEEAEAELGRYNAELGEALREARGAVGEELTYRPLAADRAAATAVPLQQLRTIESSLRLLPDQFTVHPKLGKLLEARHETFAAGHVDWGLAEAFALGSLALEGMPVRLAGEDSSRGAFSHRHAVLVDHATEVEFSPLQHLHEQQGRVEIYDSMLSEFSAMGFEYGYSIGAPRALVIWEAQYGDFVNGAQVVIDQFLTTGFDKWGQESSLVLLLPHGFEGQGPEHSSARLERFLQNAAEENVRVAVPTTTAQHFHLLRRQALQPEKRPLILMSPKSLLRTRATFSPVSDFTDRGLRPVIGDDVVTSHARRVLLCTGKLYYELTEHREQHRIDDVALIRVEQLYPLPVEQLNKALAPLGDAELVWVQEEPANMGAWRFMSRSLFVEAGRSSRGIYRVESASPATGSPAKHKREQAELVEAAFAFSG